MLNLKVMYASNYFLPYRILMRYLFHDTSFNKKHDADTLRLFDPSNYEMDVYKFTENRLNLKQESQIIYLVAKLISLLFEYDASTDLQ